MMEITPLAVLVSIPEEFLLSTLGLKLFGFPVRSLIGWLVLAAVIQALISFSVRLMPLLSVFIL